jgi:hypothetical protein
MGADTKSEALNTYASDNIGTTATKTSQAIQKDYLMEKQ